MARNNPKPSEKIDWIKDDDPTKIIAPSAAQKLAGWVKDQLPPAQRFNWFWNILNNIQIYLQGQAEDWIVIDSDADEGDYATLAAYIADAPAVGDRILVKEDQTVTAQVILPANVTLKFLDGTRLLCATNIATSVLKLGSNPIIEGVLNIVLSQTGTTAKAVEMDGDNAVGRINIENSSTGTLTTGYHINANKKGNRIEGFIQNTGGGTITNEYVDNSTGKSNLLLIISEPSNKVIATNMVDLESEQLLANKSMVDSATLFVDSGDVTKKIKFQLVNISPGATRTWTFPDSNQTFVGLTLAQSITNKELGVGTKIALGSDADGDIYYRDAGILKRLPKGSNNQILELIGGLPSWSNLGGTYTPTLTGIANFTSATSRPAFYSRVGNIVTVRGLFQSITVPSAGTLTQFRVDLPIASNLAAAWDAGGAGANWAVGVDTVGVVMQGDTANDEIIFTFYPGATSNNLLSYTFSYEII